METFFYEYPIHKKMDAFIKSIQIRSQTGELNKDHHYLVVEGGKARYVGKYDLTYHTGTGDGMETVYRFNNMGTSHDETDYRWRNTTKYYIQISETELEAFRKL